MWIESFSMLGKFKGTQAWDFSLRFLQKPNPYGPKVQEDDIFKRIFVWFASICKV